MSALAPTTQTPVIPATFTQDQIELIKRTVAQGCTDDELMLFSHVAQRTGLDPFARQIYAIKRAGKMTIQTGIDGYRLAAARTGVHAGTDDAVFVEGNGRPEMATVTVYKIVGGLRVAYTASARWVEYAQDVGGMWRKMPYTMLAKCAEALALRKAFPADLSGVYTNEEMDQAGPPTNVPVDAPPAKPAPKPSASVKDVQAPALPAGEDAERKRLIAAIRRHGTETVQTTVARLKIKADSPKDCTTPELRRILAELDGPPPDDGYDPIGDPDAGGQGE